MESDKQKSIERYVRMSISNRIEHQIMSQEQGRPRPAAPGFGPEDDSLSAFFPSIPDVQQGGSGMDYSQSSSHMQSAYTQPTATSTPLAPATSGLVPAALSTTASGPVFSTTASTTIEENAATVQRILEEIQKMHPQSVHRKDHNYSFPEGLFSSEVDLEGSQQAYQHLVHGLDNPNDFLKMFDQVEADPLRQQAIFGELNFDPFD